MKKYLDNSGKVEKHIITIWVTLMIGLILGGIGGYFVFQTNDKINNDEIVEEKEEVQEISKEEEEKIKNTIDDLVFIDYFGRSIESTKDISNRELLEFVFRNLKKDEKDTDEFSLKEAQEIINKYFSREIEGEDIYLVNDLMTNGKIPLYLYEDGNFTLNSEYPAGEFFYLDIYNRIDKIEVKDDLYTVVVYKAYSESLSFFPSKYYGTLEDSFDDSNIIEEIDIDVDDEKYYTSVKEALDKINEDKLTKVTYVFRKVNGNYLLESYTL